MMDRNSSGNFELPDKLPPQNLEAEKCLLGSLMLDKEAILKVVDFLTPTDFYKGDHQRIYQAMLEIFGRGEPIDLLSLSNRLKEKNQLEDIGGNSHLADLVNTVPTASHVSNYAKIVQSKRVLRDLISASHEIGLMGYNESETPEILIDKAEQRIFQIAQRSLPQGFVAIKDTLEEAYERMEKLSRHEKPTRGIATGFKNLDNILSGLQKSDLIILASRPSLGKSTLALDIARNAALEEKLPVGVFSLEMSKDQIVDRFISAQAQVDLWRLRTGKLSSDSGNNDFTRIQHALGSLADLPIYINDLSSCSVLQIKAMSRRLQAERGLGLIIVDYLQLLEPFNPNAPLVQQVSENSRALKALAKELNIPVLVVSQLSRAVEQRMPQIPRLADLRQSGTIEQDADVVLFIYREKYYRPDSPKGNIANIIIAKHRNGPVGQIELFFDEQRVSFKSVAKEYEYSGEGSF